MNQIYLPLFSDAVIACNILNDREGIALPVYFFGSCTCCSLGGKFACVSSVWKWLQIYYISVILIKLKKTKFIFAVTHTYQTT